MKNIQTIDSHSIFVAKGRFGRATFIAWNFLVFLILMSIPIFLTTFFIAPTDSLENINQFQDSLLKLKTLGTIVNLILLYFIFVFSIKRLHDLNKSGWFSLLNLIPLVNLVFFIWLMLSIGNEEKNDFGYPHSTKSWEYGLAWIALLLFVIAGFALISGLTQILKFL